MCGQIHTPLDSCHVLVDSISQVVGHLPARHVEQQEKPWFHLEPLYQKGKQGVPGVSEAEHIQTPDSQFQRNRSTF